MKRRIRRRKGKSHILVSGTQQQLNAVNCELSKPIPAILISATRPFLNDIGGVKAAKIQDTLQTSKVEKEDS